MSITKLPSGRLRVQVYSQASKKNENVAAILGLPAGTTWPGTRQGERDAKRAREDARVKLQARAGARVTLRAFWERWTSDPLFERPKESTNLHNMERTRAFVDRFGALPMDGEWDAVVAEWLAGGQRNGQVPALRAMFNDARSGKAGRLVQVNPFAGLGLARAKGNVGKRPPTEEEFWRLIRLARELTPPSFAAYLEFACMEGFRPGELDALAWAAVDMDAGEVHVREQWNAKVGKFTLPKYGPYTGALTDPGRAVLLAMPRGESRFVFETLRGHHYTPSSRTHHWNRVRAAAGLGDVSLYLATRHYFGWYALNVLRLDAPVIAHQLGHKDGGVLVERLYGHREEERSLAAVREAFRQKAPRPPLRAVGGRVS